MSSLHDISSHVLLYGSMQSSDYVQITLNNLTVGRSVLEALRLLEAFQAVAKHGVLCPIDWKPTGDTADTINTISNTLTESYEERLANLQKEFAGVSVTDLDARHKAGDETKSADSKNRRRRSADMYDGQALIPATGQPRPQSTPPAPSIKEDSYELHKEPSHTPSHHNDCPAHVSPVLLPSHSQSLLSPLQSHTPTPPMTTSVSPRQTIARHARGTHTLDARHFTSLFSHASPPDFQPFLRGTSSGTDSLSGHSTVPSTPARLQQNMYESRTGSQILLEFADPTSSPLTSPLPRPPSLLRANTWTGPASSVVWKVEGGSPGQTRLQATFETLRKIGAGLAMPKGDVGPKERGPSPKEGEEGYFDGFVEVYG
jgi:hypothetical protein